MKKIFSILIIGCLLVLSYRLLITPVFAQREFDDYSYQYEKYRDFAKTYEEARTKYLTYQTLTAQDELAAAAKNLILSRCLVMRTYLVLLKLKIGQGANVVSATRTKLILSLDSEIGWLAEHETDIKNLTNPTFDDILATSLRFEKKGVLFSQLSYQVQANMMVGKMRSLQAESVAINFLLADGISKNAHNKDTTTLNQWLEQVKEKTYLSQKYLDLADNSLTEFDRYNQEQSFLTSFNKIRGDLEQVRVGLLGAIDKQKEILAEVKND